MSQIGGVSVVLAIESVSDITVFIFYLIGIACMDDTNAPAFALPVNNSAYFCSGQSLYYAKYY
ncbi:hypothetical protein [uncultured Parabacteroides sp.]|uniref:hypothetical protein n=1 Tax=uncultured Parabacteroides sp. TaxID=512312 RepID=UPI0025915215|nr:hypothetical protein [uncultured Parabacteroides sp.]